MSPTITTRVLQAVQGDHDAIRTLAGALARGDADGIRSFLADRGVVLSADEVGAVLGATSGSATGTATCTCTCT